LYQEEKHFSKYPKSVSGSANFPLSLYSGFPVQSFDMTQEFTKHRYPSLAEMFFKRDSSVPAGESSGEGLSRTEASEHAPPVLEVWTPETYFLHLIELSKHPEQTVYYPASPATQSSIESKNTPSFPESRYAFFIDDTTLIGTGSSAQVVRGICLKRMNNHLVAIKVYFPKNADLLAVTTVTPEEEAAAMLALSQSKHADLFVKVENHVRTIGLDKDGKEVVVDSVMMELLDEDNWQTMEKRKNGGFFTLEKVVMFSDQLSTALLCMLEVDVINQDVKPENILINREGKLKVADFGIIQTQAVAKKLENGSVGTFAYFTPEKMMRLDHLEYLGITEYDLASMSTFVCAMMVFEAITGRKLFQISDMGYDAFSSLISTYDFSLNEQDHEALARGLYNLGVTKLQVDEIIEIFKVALANDPRHRHKSPREFHDALEEALRSHRENTRPTVSISTEDTRPHVHISQGENVGRPENMQTSLASSRPAIFRIIEHLLRK
jgi:serine/threonine protein kinase